PGNPGTAGSPAGPAFDGGPGSPDSPGRAGIPRAWAPAAAATSRDWAGWDPSSCRPPYGPGHDDHLPPVRTYDHHSTSGLRTPTSDTTLTSHNAGRSSIRVSASQYVKTRGQPEWFS